MVRHRASIATLTASFLLASLVLATAAVAQPRLPQRTAVASATRTLVHQGYRAIRLRCSTRGATGRCAWQAQRRRQRCSGAATVRALRANRRTVTVTRRRCTRAQTTATAGKKPTARPSPPGTPGGSGSTAPGTGGTTTGGSGGSQPSASNPKLGFNTYTTTRTIAEQREVGATISRLFVDWALVEANQGQWDWTQPDSEYHDMVAGGLKPLLVAYTAPCWARPSTDCSNPYFTGPPDPGYDQDWIAYIRALVARYPNAAGIEIWNEPNLDQSFLPHADPARYAALLQEAYAAVKAVNPKLTVISGGLLLSPAVSGSGVVAGGYGAPQFLAGMYAAGARTAMDALGVHIYPSDYVAGVPALWDPLAMSLWLGELAPVRLAAGAAGQPLWITEMGISTTTQPGWPAPATATEQAADLTAMIKTARATANIPVLIIHSLEDQSLGYSDPNNSVNAGWGIFTADGTPKPSACAVSAAFGGSLASC